MSERLATLEALVAADPADLLGHYLLGQEYLAEGRPEDAARELSLYCDRFDGDKGAAYLTLAQARAALGDVGGARAALDAGVENAAAHRHRQLIETLEAERLRLEEAP
jgi:predicted Zn-dependent protease